MTSPWQPLPGPDHAGGADPHGTGSTPGATPPTGADYPGRAEDAAYYPYSVAFPGAGVGGAPQHATPPAQYTDYPSVDVMSGAAGAPDAPLDPRAGAAAIGVPTGPARRAGRRRVWLALVAAAVAIAAAATIGVVAGYRTAADEADANYGPRLAAAASSASAAEQRAEGMSSDLDAARSSVAAFQTEAAEASAEAADVPDLRTLADQYFSPGADISGSADALDITITESRLLTDLPALGKFLAALGFSDAVLDRMNRTRALDGTLSAQGHHCNVTWTYHPDQGLELVFEATPGH